MYRVTNDLNALEMAIDKICYQASQAARDGFTLIVLSDKKAGHTNIPIRSV